MRPLPFFILGILIGLSGCTKPASRLRRPDPSVFGTLRGATKVEVFRLDPEDGPFGQKPKRPEQKRIGGYLAVAQEADQGADFAESLADVLSNDATYTDSFAKCFDPGVAYRVSQKDETLDILVCFRCKNLYCGPPTDLATENGSFHRSRSQAALVRLAKRAFPDDAKIQELKE